jgi:hypothetical protein
MQEKGWGVPALRTKEGLSLRLGDVVLSGAAFFAAAFAGVFGYWVPDVWMTVVVYTGIGIGPLLFRWLSALYPQVKLLEVAASFWLLPSAFFGHRYLGPIVDVVHPQLVDRHLAAADLWLFGTHPSDVLSSALAGLPMDALLVCYYTYFICSTILGISLYRSGRRAIFDQYILTLCFCYVFNFICYSLFPAVGPRYFLFDIFDGSLQGAYLTPFLESTMRGPIFVRDCFPSGHTAITLVVLGYSLFYSRRVFWFSLPLGLGLIVATVAGRFHYGIDLLFAPPLAAAATSLASALCRARPSGVVLRAPAFALREPLGG